MDWRTITTSRSPKFLVKGTELADALYGPNNRFLIVETRALDEEGHPTVVYRVRDAATVSDWDIKNGNYSRVVATLDTLEDATDYCDREVALETT